MNSESSQSKEFGYCIVRLMINSGVLIFISRTNILILFFLFRMFLFVNSEVFLSFSMYSLNIIKHHLSCHVGHMEMSLSTTHGFGG